jgi:ribonucleotide monophosphatase NagD (HAD superfamily)
VVVGFDRYINYYKIQYATLCIRENPGCLFIATNRDAVTHLTDAQVCAAVATFAPWCAGMQSKTGVEDHYHVTNRTQSHACGIHRCCCWRQE